MAKVELLKDAYGNLWDYIGYDADTNTHSVVVIDVDDEGYYTNTCITCFMTDDEYKATTKVIIDC